MLRKYNLSILCIALLIILNLFILIFKKIEEKEFVNVISQNREEKKSIEDVLLLNALSFRTKANNQFVYSIENNDSILFSDLAKDSNKLIVYFAGTNFDLYHTYSNNDEFNE